MRSFNLHRIKMVHGQHMVHTQVENLDDALSLIGHRQLVEQRRQRNLSRNPKRVLSLKQELGLVKSQQGFKSITLSDRVVPAKMPRGRQRQGSLPPPKPATMTAKKERARELYATGYWKPGEIAHEVGAECDKVKKWLKGMRVYR